MGDKLRDVIAPAQPRVGEIVYRHLVMITGGIDATDHDLIAEYQLVDEFGTVVPRDSSPGARASSSLSALRLTL
jgi:hypothetical protein